ncbi:MAG: trypsin-like peptidase domain-containing protein [Bacteriovoracaceae bacterium]|nr:trypsin-like peptidase domain-containing protein [Bacteriovoracaceae bacterium]
MKMLIYLLLIIIPAKSFGTFLESEKNLIDIYKKSVPSVVNLTNIRSVGHPFFGFIEKIPAGQGSGFVWDNQGHIVTNYHVIEGGEEFQVSFYNDTKSYKARVIGSAPSKDIAVLKLEKMPPNLLPIAPGLSKDLQVGQLAIAIGNPFGLDHSMSTGIISALGRKIVGVGNVKIHDMIQTDASINQGNSGGPLLDSSGKLIGMNTMIYSTSGSSAGLGFAVPVDTITQTVPQLIQHGKIIRPSLGVQILDDRIKERFFGEKGIAISSVIDGGPADKAGLQGLSQDNRGKIYKGDLILKINDTEVNSYDDIYHELEKFKVGDKVSVTYKRDEKTKTVEITLQPL